MNIQNWRQNAEEKLQQITITPRLEAEVLLCYGLKINKATLYTYPEQLISEENLKILADLLGQRLKKIPMAYILGEQEFWSLRFEVSPDVLIPRPETEHLIEIMLELFSKPTQPPACQDWTLEIKEYQKYSQQKFSSGKRILELGTGSGAIAITLAKELPSWKIFAIDNSPVALAMAQKNALNLLPLDQVTFFLSNWFDHIPPQTFSVIVSNPPYIASNDPHLSALEHEPRSALVAGKDGLDDIQQIITQSPDYLEPGGILLLEHGHMQASAIQKLFEKAQFKEIVTLSDLAGKDRITMGIKG